uniref:Uncharacterized protein n=1 Tax=Oryza punctata TaxID=4537 RepID=A0A0E0LUU6_ORYPU
MGRGPFDPSTDLTRDSTLRKFKVFFRGFTSPTGDFPYQCAPTCSISSSSPVCLFGGCSESLIHHRDHVTVTIDDLNAFDVELSDKIWKLLADYLPLFDMASSEVLVSLWSKVAGETGEMEEPVTGDVQILLSSKENCLSMSLLKNPNLTPLCCKFQADYMSELVKIAGITIAASRVKAKSTLLCKNCRSPCPLDPWIAVPEKSKYVDLQTIKLQENPEDVPTGELPRNMLLSTHRHLVQTIVPGTRLVVLGIYSVYQASAKVLLESNILTLELWVSGTRAVDPYMHTQMEMEFKEFAQRSDAYAKICSMIGPSIYGHSYVKKAITCLLFGGSKNKTVAAAGDLSPSSRAVEDTMMQSSSQYGEEELERSNTTQPRCLTTIFDSVQHGEVVDLGAVETTEQFVELQIYPTYYYSLRTKYVHMAHPILYVWIMAGGGVAGRAAGTLICSGFSCWNWNWN